MLLRCVIAGLATIATVLLPQPVRGARPALADVFDLYNRGRFDDALAAFDHLGGVEGLIGDLQGLAPAWARAAEPGAADRRRLVVATVVIELAHARDAMPFSRRPGLIKQTTPLTSWAAEFVRNGAPAIPIDAERWWYHAASALYSPTLLLGRPVFGSLSEAPRMAAEVDRFDKWERAVWKRGFLADAVARFPEDPTFWLAQLEAREAVIDTVRPPTVAFQASNIRRDELPPGYQDQLLQVVRNTPLHFWDSARDEKARKVTESSREAVLLQFVPELLRDYADLMGRPEVRAEAALHRGFLQVRFRLWDAAVDSLAVVPTATTDSYLIYLSDYLRGWAESRAGRPAQAAAAYEAALAAIPHVRSAATLYAAALMQMGDQAHAFQIDDDAVNTTPAVPDPWDLFKLGEARLWPDDIAKLRGALR